MPSTKEPEKILILGIGNVLMGDEGVGIHVINYLKGMQLPGGVDCLDGGTGGFYLLEPIPLSDHIIMIDATLDGAPAGKVRRLRPRFSSDYPPTLTAHDIGLKDLLDALYQLEDPPDMTLFAVSIPPLQELSMVLSPELAELVPEIAHKVLQEADKREPFTTAS
ncbi:MAG: hydrogenase maturation protease [bacterium]